MVTNFVKIVATMKITFLGKFENPNFIFTVVVTTFCHFWKSWATFIPSSGHTAC